MAMKYDLDQINHLIQNRRSIFPKDYGRGEVTKEQITALLENARWAPTHAMTQPWRFVVFHGEGCTDFGKWQAEEYKKQEGDDYNPSKYEKIIAKAEKASAIIAIGLKRQSSEKLPLVEEISAVACAVQNIHLTATAMGLAGYWCTGGMTYTKVLRKHLGLKKNDSCMGLFYLGLPADPEKKHKSHRDDLKKVVEWRG